MTEHVEGRVERQDFARELKAIEDKVLELFVMVAEDVPRATDALLNGNSDAARALAERDRVIDDLYPQIEELANREMLLQQPLASDFRLLVSILRVMPELERSHDLIIHIAGRGSLILSQGLPARSRAIIGHMGGSSHPKCGARRSAAGARATVPLRLRAGGVGARGVRCRALRVK